MRRLVEEVRPRLIDDGMFLVGLDIVGDKLMKINVFSPGGLGSAQKFTKINFARYVINALERKASYMQFYEQCPVLSAPGEIRAARLQLCVRVADTLRSGLSLLGIETVDRM